MVVLDGNFDFIAAASMFGAHNLVHPEYLSSVCLTGAESAEGCDSARIGGIACTCIMCGDW